MYLVSSSENLLELKTHAFKSSSATLSYITWAHLSHPHKKDNDV